MSADRASESTLIARRILAAVDASAHGLAALEQAAALAFKLNADLEAVFVEDATIPGLAELPVVCHVGFSGNAATLDRAMLESLMRAQTRRVKEATDAIAARLGRQIPLRVVRGRVMDELLAAAANADLVLIGWSSAPAVGRRRIGTTAQRIAQRSTGPVLVIKDGVVVLSAPVAVVFDGSAGSERALMSAAALAETDTSRLTVLLATGEAAGPRADAAFTSLETRARELLRGHALNLRFRAVSSANCTRIAAAVAHVEIGILVVARDCPMLDVGTAERSALDVLACPVMVVR